MAEFADLIAELQADPAVSAGKMFGHDGARLGRKFFAVDFDGDVVLKLGDARLTELLDAGAASPFEPLPGRRMGGWARVALDGADLSELVALAEEAKRHLAATL